jgi:glycosyltransferase involved in cell wall biosynthesis
VILYLAATLPMRSETFVYREIFALRDQGVDVRAASVHRSATGLDAGGPLDRLAAEAVQIYGSGAARLLMDAAGELMAHPIRCAGTLGRGVADAAFSRDVTFPRRPKVLWQAVAALALARRVRPMGVAHIHCHMAHVPTTIGMYAARQLGIGFSFTGHANDLFPSRTLLAEKLRRAAWVNCISRWHRGFYRSVVDRSDDDLPVIRCAVDTDAYPVTPVPGRPMIEVLGVGRLVEKKGFDVLIEAAGEIARRGLADVRVQIAGGGPEEARLRAIIDGLAPGAAVELLGETDNDRVMELMGEVDIFALPCRVTASGDRDGIPVVLMEAMARGRCVISGDLEAIRELVIDGETGVMIPPGDRSALVDALVGLARDRDRVDQLGRSARGMIESEFDLRVNALRIMAVMERHGLGQGQPRPAK